MGSYAHLRLGDFTVTTTKNEVHPAIMVLFRAEDKRKFEVWPNDPVVQGQFIEEAFEEGELVTVVHYACHIYVLRDRLELLGFTKDVAVQAFYKGLRSEIERTEYWLPLVNDEKHKAHSLEKINMLKSLTVDAWLDGVEEVRKNNIERQNVMYGAAEHYKFSPPIRYLASSDFCGFPGYDPRSFLRLILERHSDSSELVYDLTDVVYGGYVDADDDLVYFAERDVSDDFITLRRTIVLTEGTTDKWVLERTLKLLYPYIADYFRFMDFEGARVQGGAGALANLVKAFVGVGIDNKVLALFDNDTAAEAALRVFEKISLPNNVVVLRYPDIELANNYPTVGPSGLVTMNVNGLAGSIELYMGSDVLQGEPPGFKPIQWTGYEKSVGRYQGEVLDKHILQQRFSEKLEACEADPSKIEQYDWSNMNEIIKMMREAFHRNDAARINREETSFYKEMGG